MEEKKEIKVRLSTVISMFVIFILIIALGVTYYFGFVADKNESSGEEKVTNTTENVVSNVANEDKTDKENVNKEENVVTNKEENNKLDEEKCKHNFQKFLDITSTFNSGSIEILHELELVDGPINPDDYELTTYEDVKHWDMNTFHKTDVKYSEYKEEMQKYMTLDCMEDNFSDYTRNNKGELHILSYGGTHVYREVQKLTESSSNNVYNIKVSTRAEDDGSTGTENYIVTFDDNCKVKNVKEK